MFREVIAHLHFGERAIFFALRCYAANSILPGTLTSQDGTEGDLTSLFGANIHSLIYKGVTLGVMAKVDGLWAFPEMGEELALCYHYPLCEVYRKKHGFKPPYLHDFLSKLFRVLKCEKTNRHVLDLYQPKPSPHKIAVKDRIDKMGLEDSNAEILLNYIYKFAGREKFENRILPTKKAALDAVDEIENMLTEQKFYFRGTPYEIDSVRLFGAMHKVNMISTVFNLSNNNYLKKAMMSVAVADTVGNQRHQSIFMTEDGDYL